VYRSNRLTTSFYCIVLLTTLFVSSCYWQPFPITNPLSTSWSENVTTFAEALNASLTNTDVQLPSVMRVVDRCWCDFSNGDLFEPYNVTNWERISVERLREDLERKNKVEDTQSVAGGDIGKLAPNEGEISQAAACESRSPARRLRSIFDPLYRKPRRSHAPPPLQPPQDIPKDKSPEPTSNENLPLIRREYDLRPHGLGIIIDFGWTRSLSQT